MERNAATGKAGVKPAGEHYKGYKEKLIVLINSTDDDYFWWWVYHFTARLKKNWGI